MEASKDKYSIKDWLLKKWIFIWVILFAVAPLISSIPGPCKAFACDNVSISDVPMEVAIKAAPPNIMYLLDDSGSMDWEFMTSETDGLFSGRYYVFKDDDYDPQVDHNYGRGHSLFADPPLPLHWKSQWSGYNKLYYNPHNVYKPWPGMTDANTVTPRSNPINASPVFHLSNEFAHVEADDYGSDWQHASWVDCGNFTANFDYKGDHDVFKVVLGTNGTLTVRTYDAGNCTDTMGRILDASGNPYRTNDYPNPKHYGWTGNAIYDDDCGSHLYCNPTCHSDDWNFYIQLANVPAGTYYIDVMEYHNDGTGNYTMSIDFTGSCSTAPPPPPKPVPVTIYNAHYYVWDDNNTNGNVDAGEIYLVNFEDTDGDGILDARKFYKFIGSGDIVSANELVPIADQDVPDAIRAHNKDDDGNSTGVMSFSEELQNFANWFSYYRRRQFTAKAAVGFSIDKIGWAQVGFYTINSSSDRQCVLPINVVSDNGTVENDKDTLLNKLYHVGASGYTPLRRGLKKVGQYLAKGDGTNGGMCNSPIASADHGGMCQQSFCIAMTDGFWNGYSPSVGNQDGNQGPPYADNYSNTLADVAMKYYKHDIAPNLENVVPTNACDQADWQHMVTYTVSFGVHGTLPYPWVDNDHDGKDDDPCFLNSATPMPQWPNPTSGEQKKIDDLWHAAVNGRGLFFSAANPAELVDALNSITSNLLARLASGASVAVNGEELNEHSVVYQTIYKPDQWTGNLFAYPIDPATGEVKRDENSVLWNAADKLKDQDWDTGRTIITSDGVNGVAFRYNNLSTNEKALLNNNPDLVDYIRGKDVTGFRERAGKLGDLVHSAPTLLGDYLYVGGNDGMLHAFNKNTGQEQFAYIPSMVYSNLPKLADPYYSHKFFVDLTPTAVNTGNKAILVGGLGAGGRGYFALDITDPASITESNAGNVLLWEYHDDNDMGLSYSKAAIVRSNSAAHPWIVVFGNGYNSPNGSAVLFILDAFTGQLITKIDTGAAGCNGLSTPAVVDINGDFKADYAYAGDLKGNLWKFDLTGDSGWHLSYSKPLFTAKNQPITAKPDVMKHCSKLGYMVLFGTGKFLSEEDKTDTSLQTLYGIWDYGDNNDPSEYVGTFNPATGDLTDSPLSNIELVQQQATKVGNVGKLSDNEMHWSTVPDINGIGSMPDPGGTNASKASVGWYLNLDSLAPGERLTNDVMIRGGKGIFITLAPDNSPCSGGGKSALYEVDACSGGKTRNPAFLPDNSPPGEHPNVIYKKFIMYPPKILELPPGTGGGGGGNGTTENEEMKLISTSQGTIIRQDERAPTRGFSYWKEW